MSNNNDRTDTARRNDDRGLIELLESKPGQGSRSGGNLQRDIGTQAEEQHIVDGKSGITRVRKEDEKD